MNDEEEVHMKFKKVLSMTLLAAMLATTLAACGNSGSGSSSGTKQESGSGSESGGTSSEGVTLPFAETQKYTMFSVIKGADYPLEENIAFQKLCNDANIEFDIQSVLGADLGEKKGLVLASGDYPDIFFKSGFSSAEMTKYGSQGVLIPLQDLIRQYAPNLTKLLDERDAWQYLQDQDGNVWSLPEVDRQDPGITVLWIDKKWMDELGLKEPTSLDELYTVLKAFKDNDVNGNGDKDDEIPFTANAGGTTDLLLPYFNLNYDQGTRTAIDGDKVVYVPTSDTYKEYLAYITKLYQEGILDKNCFTQAPEQQGAIGKSGDIFGAFFDAGAFLTVGRDNDDDYIALTPFTKGTYPVTSGIIPGTLCITDACKNPEYIIAWADQLYSQDGGALAWLGVEGETYEMADDGTWSWLLGKHGDDVSTVRASSTIQGTANHPSVQPDIWYTGMTDATDPDEVYLNGERAKLTAVGAKPRPAMFFSEAGSQTLGSLTTDLNSYAEQYKAQVATGELDLDSSWDEYVSTMEAMGASQVQEIYQNAYDGATK
jgi:ABC transporter, substrate-binding protein, family 1